MFAEAASGFGERTETGLVTATTARRTIGEGRGRNLINRQSVRKADVRPAEKVESRQTRRGSSLSPETGSWCFQTECKGADTAVRL
jgi:hypothetical protein